MELRYLRYFVAVAELQNFTRASEVLHVAQSAISQQIQALELELGVQLLARTKRSVHLTTAGQAFLHEALEILARVEQSSGVARRAATGETGSLSIGCFGSASSLFLPGLVQAYRQQFPLVKLQLFELTPDQQLEAFEHGHIDLGFTRPLPRSHAERFVQAHVYRDRTVVALHDRHPLAREEAIALTALADEDWVLLRRSVAPGLVDGFTQLCVNAGFSPKLVAEPLAMHIVLMLVAAGLGASIVPNCVRSFGQPGLSFLPLRDPSPPIDMVAVRPASEPRPTVAAFLELLQQQLPTIQQIYETQLCQRNCLAP